MVLFECNGRFGKISGELEDNAVSGSEVGLMTNLKIEPQLRRHQKKGRGCTPALFKQSIFSNQEVRYLKKTTPTFYEVVAEWRLCGPGSRRFLVWHKLRTYTDIPACSQSCPTNS